MVFGQVGAPYDLKPLYDCTNDALKYINCDSWLPNVPQDYHGVAVFIDDGLTTQQWTSLESWPWNLDIIKYVKIDSNGRIKTYGGPGMEFFNGGHPFTNQDLLGGNPEPTHGVGVLAAFGSVARNAKVIFVDVQVDGENEGKDITTYKIWNEIYSVILPYYDVDVISTSVGYIGDLPLPNTIATIQRIKNRYQVPIIAASGNTGSRLNMFPVNLPDVWRVSSVDHEGRNRCWGFFKCRTVAYEGRVSTFSSYGSSSQQDPDIVDFVMPGNGVPILTGTTKIEWRYGLGTSFSTPYLAAAIMIASFAYSEGYDIRYGLKGTYYTDPSVADIYLLLKKASSRTAWDYKAGWGYIDLHELYTESYKSGRCTPREYFAGVC